MSDTAYTDLVGPAVNAAWLNDVNSVTYKGPSGYVYVGNGAGSLGTWTAISSITVGNATNAVNATNATNATNAVNVTGTVASGVTGTTQTLTDSSTKLATTAFVQGQAPNYQAAALVNNTGAGADVSLTVGQTAYVDFSAATSVLLHIATGDNQLYELVIEAAGNAGATNITTLNPNNTTYTNFFADFGYYSNSTGPGQIAQYSNGFMIGFNGDPRFIGVKVSTKTTSKTVTGQSLNFNSLPTVISCYHSSVWQSSASSSGAAGDTTTAWTSLGTLSFPVAATGRAYIKRIA